MKYERFEDLPVWKLAIEIALRVYKLTRERFFTQPGDLRGQLRRSSLSISNNIAEGFVHRIIRSRSSKKNFIFEI